ncbi:MAG TPA: hypothetical protein VH062_00705 [Polyangiaceae bacterium]|jgi:hypothetical protein|nr:hypothetical protein [Polyangiaceae bacterium]
MNKLHGPRRIFGVLGATAALAAATAFSGTALADGGIPRGYGILFEPGNSAHMLIHSQYWGLFDSRSGPTSWNLLCSQAFGGRSLDPDNYATVLAQGGRILVAGDFSGLIISDDTCDWKKIDAFNGEPVQTISPADTAGKGFLAVTVQGEMGGVTSRVYSSTDRGDTWTKLKGAIDADISIQGIAVAPSDPMRVYAVGVKINSGPREIAVSTDGGASFKTLPVGAMTDYDATQVAPLSVVGIAPDDPDTLFVRADGSDAAGFVLADELWVSSDAGKTWKKTYQPADMHDLPGFTFTPDGKSVLIAGPAEGLLKASVADAVAAKAGAFTKVFTGAVWGLRYQDGKLYAGNDDYAMKPPFMFGVSEDDGKTFTGIMGHCDVGFPKCDPSSTMQMVCAEQWQRVGGYQTDYIDMCPTGTTTGMNGLGGSALAGTGGVAGSGGSSSSTTGGATNTAGVPGGAAAGSPQTVGGAGGTSGTMHVGIRDSGCSVGPPQPDGAGKRALLVSLVAMVLCAVRKRPPPSRRVQRPMRKASP